MPYFFAPWTLSKCDKDWVHGAPPKMSTVPFRNNRNRVHGAPKRPRCPLNPNCSKRPLAPKKVHGALETVHGALSVSIQVTPPFKKGPRCPRNSPWCPISAVTSNPPPPKKVHGVLEMVHGALFVSIQVLLLTYIQHIPDDCHVGQVNHVVALHGPLCKCVETDVPCYEFTFQLPLKNTTRDKCNKECKM